MIDQTAESGADVVDVLEDVVHRVIDAEVPDLAQMSDEGRPEIAAE
jgi:hypothetical protein